jgi:acetoin utilization deacetylase AcuC-like enzyme
MKTIYTEKHKLHHGDFELVADGLVPVFEMPRRAEIILARVKTMNLGEILAPKDFGLEPIKRIHLPAYVHFLENAWAEWVAAGHAKHALPYTWAVRGMNQSREPVAIEAKLGFYSFDAAAPITPTTWEAITGSVNVALTGAELIKSGSRSAFALCRPPGHHAAADYMGGYCFFNNVAVAAQYFLDSGAARVAILDIDYHHGNGTQTIFYARDDVLVLNLHGDPSVEYPYFLGYADETGVGIGEGFNINYPMPHRTNFETWFSSLELACHKLKEYAPDVVLVSLGVDTYKNDPISQFLLESEDYIRIGSRIAKLGLPTLFVMEGGYAVEEIGVNAVNVLMGFES